MPRARGAAVVAVAYGMTMLVGATPPARVAAKISIVPRQSMDWGLVIPGAAAHVDPTDIRRRGQLDFVGKDRADARVLLPRTLVSSNGALLPVRFVRGDLVVTYSGRGETQIPDPALPIDIDTKGNNGDASLFIGGTALPTIGQRAGTYDALITVVFVNTTI